MADLPVSCRRQCSRLLSCQNRSDEGETRMQDQAVNRTTPDTAIPREGVFENLHEIIKKARQNLNQNEWDYIVGATETETTMRRNRMALDSIAFRPRVLCDVGKVDATVERLGRKLRLPVVLAPVGALDRGVDLA